MYLYIVNSSKDFDLIEREKGKFDHSKCTVGQQHVIFVIKKKIRKKYS